MSEPKKKPPAGRTAPAGENSAPTAREGKPCFFGAEGDNWARDKLLWACLNALEMRRQDLVIELADVDAAEDRIRGRVW